MRIIKDRIRAVLLGTFSCLTIMSSLCANEVVITPSTTLEQHPMTIDIFTELLYWYTSEAVDWAFTLSQDQNSETSSFKTFVFDWAPGFRVGLGRNMHDNWKTHIGYSWFRSKAQAHTQGDVTPAFFAARLSALEPFAAGEASLNLHYNIFDWELVRTFLISQYLYLEPSIGLKGGWIKQIIHSRWTLYILDVLPFYAIEDLHQTFQGGGPKGALGAKWLFDSTQKYAFSLIGQFEVGYLWGHWSIRDEFIDDLDTIITVKTSERNYGALMLHSFLGFGWDYNFNSDKTHVGIKLGYEIEDWVNQCQIFTDSSGSQNNDLILQGFTLGVRFDF